VHPGSNGVHPKLGVTRSEHAHVRAVGAPKYHKFGMRTSKWRLTDHLFWYTMGSRR
jgi:hypothetical protein